MSHFKSSTHLRGKKDKSVRLKKYRKSLRKSVERAKEKTENAKKNEFQKLKREWDVKKKLISSSLDIFNLTNSKLEMPQQEIEILVGPKVAQNSERLSQKTRGKERAKEARKSRSRTRFADSNKLIGLETTEKKKTGQTEKKVRGQFERQKTNMTISQNADVKSVSDSSFEWLLNKRNAENRSRKSSSKKSYQERLKESFLQKKNNRSKSGRKGQQKGGSRFGEEMEKEKGALQGKQAQSLEMEKDLMIKNKLI